MINGSRCQPALVPVLAGMSAQFLLHKWHLARFSLFDPLGKKLPAAAVDPQPPR